MRADEEKETDGMDPVEEFSWKSEKTTTKKKLSIIIAGLRENLFV